MKSDIVVAKIELAKGWVEFATGNAYLGGGQSTVDQMSQLFDFAYKAISSTIAEADRELTPES